MTRGAVQRKPVATTETCLACGESVGVYRDTTTVTHHDADWKYCTGSGTAAHTGNEKALG